MDYNEFLKYTLNEYVIQIPHNPNLVCYDCFFTSRTNGNKFKYVAAMNLSYLAKDTSIHTHSKFTPCSFINVILGGKL